VRTILNDSEILAGDVFTDTAPEAFDCINSGYERVQIELASYGIEVSRAEAWLVGLPIMPSVDPEARLIVDDNGTTILYPNGVGNSFSLTPQLPIDLVLPLDLFERQTATASSVRKLNQPNAKLLSLNQRLYLIDWQWESDGLRFRGALQSQDVRIDYEKHLPKLAATTDPVPIRGVLNAAAYQSALLFAESRGGLIAPQAKAHAAEEIFLLQQVNVRRRQRKQVRRQPYSGRGGGRAGYPFL